MKFDTALLLPNLSDMAAYTQAAEAIGFDGIWTSETNADPFLPLALAAEHSQKLTLGTAIAVAFPRSPTALAYLAWDLARYSNGRFILGLGTQVKAHNERRFGVKWEKPVRKLRETIEAMHAIWNCWQNGTPLDYQGEFFQLNLMTPFFSSGPLPTGRPPVYISAVNHNMLRLAGRLCDGVHIHAFHTPRYLREVALPELTVGLTDSSRSRADLQINTSLFVVPTDDHKPAAEHELFAKQQLSFYMSTPAYRVVVELHGWQETAWKLSKMARRGEWEQMPHAISDEILAEFAVSGTWAELPGQIKSRYKGGLLDRLSYYLPFTPGENDAAWRTTIEKFRQD
ncbi:MAG: TIGR03617 family F420-dependent LLM class oxidoreductase [Anaerolineales bacterium]|nr:TIGR03617 family F420-dependent LLM class oxidoreductase [Anaerolineales bacterium]